jgi:RNA 2',3'-cyclic 3'-phosphodiesterase
VRLFICFDLPAPVREEFAAFISSCKKKEPRAKWVRAEAMHLTLKFLGETREDQVSDICRALESVHSSSPMDIRYRGLGFFPDGRHPRVFWAGVQASANLADIAHAINGAVKPLGFPAEDREFAPHLTLARISAPGKWDKLVQIASEFSSHEFGTSRETEFHLIQSFLKPNTAEYKRLASFPFVEEPA